MADDELHIEILPPSPDEPYMKVHSSGIESRRFMTSKEVEETYGISPAVIFDLPLIKADNERTRQRNIDNEPNN